MADEKLPLARRYRSKTLAEYIGNDSVKTSLLKALESNVKPQVMLFSGPAGCGKTSLARLVCKEMVCEHRSLITGACGECPSCRAIDEFIETGDAGGLIAIREVDVGQANTKDDIDELLSEANTPVFGAEWRVFILDEVHNMSIGAQTLMLKTLEEPPEHVMFLLCTTNPEKILPTIRGRCQYRFQITKPKKSELVQHLVRICEAEGFKYDTKGLALVVNKGGCVPRDTLNLLERVIREKADCTYENAVSALNASDSYYFEFYKSLLENKSIYGYIKLLAEIKSRMTLQDFVSGLLAFTVKGLYATNGVVDLEVDESEVKNLTRVFSRYDGVAVVHLLDQLMEAQSSPDSETQLLYMGYSIIYGETEHKTESISSGLEDGARNVGKTMAKEKQIGMESFVDKKTATPEEIQEVVAKNMTRVGGIDLASMFTGAKKANIDLPDK